jgi:hypothetical protein
MTSTLLARGQGRAIGFGLKAAEPRRLGLRGAGARDAGVS